MLLADGVLASCQLIDMEVLYAARNLRDYRALQRSLAALPRLDVTTQVWDRALEVQHCWLGVANIVCLCPI